MRIENTTKFTMREIVKAAMFAGVNLKAEGVIYVDVLTSDDKDEHGVCYNSSSDAVHVIEIREGKGLEVLVHEMRHVGQAQQLGGDVFNVLYKYERETVEYSENALEVDAWACQRAWEGLNK